MTCSLVLLPVPPAFAPPTEHLTARHVPRRRFATKILPIHPSPQMSKPSMQPHSNLHVHLTVSSLTYYAHFRVLKTSSPPPDSSFVPTTTDISFLRLRPSFDHSPAFHPPTITIPYHLLNHSHASYPIQLLSSYMYHPAIVFMSPSQASSVWGQSH